MSKAWVAGFAAALCAAPAMAQERGSTFDRPYWLDRSVIEAIGRAQIEALPDRASFSVTFEEVARESGAASAAAADRARLATAAMRQRGGDTLELRSNVSHPTDLRAVSGSGRRSPGHSARRSDRQLRGARHIERRTPRYQAGRRCARRRARGGSASFHRHTLLPATDHGNAASRVCCCG